MIQDFSESLRGIADQEGSVYARALHGRADDTGQFVSTLRRRRMVRQSTTTVLGAAATAALAFGAVEGWGALHLQPAAGPTGSTPTASTSPAPTASTSPAPTESAINNAALPALGQWQDAGVDPSVFGLVTIRDAVTFGGRAVVVGCTPGTATVAGFPAWVGAGPTSWTRAHGPAAVNGQPVGCLEDLVVTPFGLFAQGSSLFRSVDGVTWDQVVLGSSSDAPGSVDAAFAVGNRLTVLVSRMSLAESTKASMYTTTDGVTWTSAPAAAAAIFDNAEVDSVIATSDGLLAVGASPGGSFVPTAAVWVSADGLTWQRVTPVGGGFADAYMYAVSTAPNGFVAVGPNSGNAGRIAAWSSPDGVTWTRATTPAEQVNASTAYLAPRSLTRLGGTVYAAGLDSDSSRPQQDWDRPALWSTTNGATWQRVDLAGLPTPVPFAVTELNGTLIGFSPAADWPGPAEPVHVLTAMG